LKTSLAAPFALRRATRRRYRLRGTGWGGRNQELALAAANELDGSQNLMLVTLATDGENGPTNCAGAVVTGDTLTCAWSLGLDASDFLRRNDSYHFFKALGDGLLPSPSGKNVNDLIFIAQSIVYTKVLFP
jgi:glycerate 2-kinase